MIIANDGKIEIKGSLGDCMVEAVNIVKAITETAWHIVENKCDAEESNSLIQELTDWGVDIIEAVMPEK